MNNLFLLNKAVDVNTYSQFTNGMTNLILIDKKSTDTFNKNDLLWSIPIIDEVYVDSSQIGKNIIIFLSQMTSLDVNIENETTFDARFPNDKNAFLGIDFTNCGISPVKQITNEIDFENWKISNMTIFEKLKVTLGDSINFDSFEKEFSKLQNNVQKSILLGFERAKSRNLVTPFYPDVSLIKDVTPSKHTCKVMELRIFSPVAIRVYFNETNRVVYLASIEAKSNPNQSEDIKNAHDILSKLINKT
jgi:hypothetical protein